MPGLRRLRSRWWIVLALALVAFAAIRWAAPEDRDPASARPLAGFAASSSPGSGLRPPADSSQFSAGAAAWRQQQIAMWQQRYDRAAHVYTSYHDATRYPPDSRPLREHPDQLKPFNPVVDEMPLRDRSGQVAAQVRIRTAQDRVFLAGAESTRLSVEATDAAGQRVPVVVRSAAVQALVEGTSPSLLPRVEILFNDEGRGADEAAGDGRHTALVAPSTQGLGDRAGTLRVIAEVSAGGSEGVVPFDVVYEPQVPATWGPVREALEGGALNFYLQAQVEVAGRYVASARVLDANARPVALLQFNDELPRGRTELRFSLAGVLVHDLQPAFPLQLVDVDGFLLKPDTSPDRAMMPRRPGVVHVSRRYAADAFSTEEWQSEERQRHLTEYGRDMEEARAAIDRLRPR